MKKTIPISDSVNAKLLEIAKKFGGGHVRVGFLEDKKYPDGAPVAQVAFWNEFGHGGPFPAPPRTFFRTMVTKYSPMWPRKLVALAKLHDYDGPAILGAMGDILKGELLRSIEETNAPALSPTTALLHSRFPGTSHFEITIEDVLQAQRDVKAGVAIPSGTVAKPLVWSDVMKQSVDFEVTK